MRGFISNYLQNRHPLLVDGIEFFHKRSVRRRGAGITQRAERGDVCISSTGLGLMIITDLAFLLPAAICALKSCVIKHGVVGAGVSLLSLPVMQRWGWPFLPFFSG